MSPTHLVVSGMMGVGKTTTARAVAALLGLIHGESDEDIERLFDRTGFDIAESDGVDALHSFEESVLLGALAHTEPLVISAAGWIVENADCRAALENRAFTILLKAPLDVLAERIATGTHRRHISMPDLEELATKRAPLFDAVADATFDARQPTDVLATEIVRVVGESSLGWS
jgi:shikimate kinase